MTTTGVALTNGHVPSNFFLEQNYPNPFNPRTVISYQLAVNSIVTLRVYDMLGREVETLVNSGRRPDTITSPSMELIAERRVLVPASGGFLPRNKENPAAEMNTSFFRPRYPVPSIAVSF